MAASNFIRLLMSKVLELHVRKEYILPPLTPVTSFALA